MASQSLAECREKNNPYIPGNMGLFGPTRQQMYGPDPCEAEEEALRGATVAHQDAVALAQRSAAPTPQDVQSAPAPQLSSSWEINNLDPSIPMTELLVPQPFLNSSWSPTDLDEVMAMIAEELETQTPGSSSSEEMIVELQGIRENMVAFLSWDPWKPVKKRKKYQYLPKNAEWIGAYLPK
ncbi:nonstructural protein 2 [Peafowl parvovirus 1]|uniref:Nonstructural protein 2 n=1 Tax=Peafowl parvovirus 1 TaxID=2668086 RepID=A0A649UXV7_9VIRU|nr:nonstructural protein 2 [Peafowl parvovirus 1]QGJ83202.1 nonstructural protein 2 [Peafowl parvovirus 1]